MKNKKTLIIGSTGMLGQALTKKLEKAGTPLYLSSFPETPNDHILLDITNSKAVEKVFQQIDPDIVYNCAAYTDVDKAEEQVEIATAVNGNAPGILATNCANHNATLVHISTDYVFDGQGNKPYKPEDQKIPNTVYGRTKLHGENEIIESQCNYIIIRTSWLFGPDGKNFVDTISSLSQTRDELKVVSDQIGCPTFTLDLADCMITLAQKEVTGVFHFCNPPACSWHEFACEIVKLAGSKCKVNPCTTEEFPRPAPRPAYSVMDISKTEQALGHKIRPWQETLKQYFPAS